MAHVKNTWWSEKLARKVFATVQSVTSEQRFLNVVPPTLGFSSLDAPMLFGGFSNTYTKLPLPRFNASLELNSNDAADFRTNKK
jgi:hypothetical protein